MTLIRFPGLNPFSKSGHVPHCHHACHCDCHKNIGVVHSAPCGCTMCPICNGFVIFLESHLKECHPDYKCLGGDAA